MSSAIYVNKDFDDYCYLVEASDNYVILTNQHSVSGSYQSPKTIKTLTQYLKPSFYFIESTKDYSKEVEFEVVDISTRDYSRADFCEIFIVQFFLIAFFIFLFNGLTRFIRKGGVFFGK